MSDLEQNHSDLHLTVEQWFKLVRQHLRLWSHPDKLGKVYPQTMKLAQLLSHSVSTQPGKWVAQFHQHKPHYDQLTNLTVQAAVFAALQVCQARWPQSARHSIIAAALTANIAVLRHMDKQVKGNQLTDKEKAVLAKGGIYSYQLLKKNQVLDVLWLNTLSAALPISLAKSRSVGMHGVIVNCAWRFARALNRANVPGKVHISQVLKQLLLDSPTQANCEVVQQAAYWLRPLGTGSLVMLANGQAAQVMQPMPEARFLVFVFAGEELTPKGRFVVVAEKHLATSKPCYVCDESRLYSQLWEAPLQRIAADKSIALPTIEYQASGIFEPPKTLCELTNTLFEQPDLNKICEQIADSPQLTRLLTETATQLAGKDVKIKDARHALAMLGLNRVGPLLIQGALTEMVMDTAFPCDFLARNRLECLLQAVKFYARYTDLISAEELTLYTTFWLAPLFMSKPMHHGACQLQRFKAVKVDDAFAMAPLFGLALTDEHKQQVLELAKSWQLPQLSIELFRQINKPETTIKPAKRIVHALAVIRMATLHTHTIFHQVDIRSPFLQQHLSRNLEVLGLTLKHFLGLPDKFLLQHQPATPLI